MEFLISTLITGTLFVIGSSFDIIWPMIFISSLLLAIDSKIIQIKKYKTSLAFGPAILFIACVLMWIYVFPWYVVVRYRIKKGLIPENDGTYTALKVRSWVWYALAAVLAAPVIIFAVFAIPYQLFGIKVGAGLLGN